jgi:FtsP/CotA-like multicopper oxidase with cupredoxin domain
MRYFFAAVFCFFALQNFAQDGMDMNMNDNNYLPFAINHAVIKSWSASNLFKTEFDTSALFYLKGAGEHTITIKAFQQKFYDDPEVLKPVWVLGYIANKSNLPPSLPGPVIIAEYAHPTKIFWVNKIFETLRNLPDYKLYPTYDSARKVHPFVPIIYNMNDPLHVHMVADALYPDFRKFPTGVDTMDQNIMELSTYYSATVHLHGANVTWQNDGYPTSFYYPATGAAPVNITWGLFGKFEQNKTGQHYFYPNTFPEGETSLIKARLENVPFVYNAAMKNEGHHGAILWYHDHAMMRTAPDVYTGQTGIYIINGEDDRVFSSTVIYSHDVPLILADRSFTESNYLYYNTTQSNFAAKGEAAPPEAGEGQPEFLGNTITVNGKIWPFMKVDRSLYRFRIVNTSNTRFYRFAVAKWKNGKIDTSGNATLSNSFIQVGTEGGFFPDGNFPRIGNDSSALTLAPSERADVLINFSVFPVGTSLVLLNYAPDAVYDGDSITPIKSDSTFDDLTNYVMLFHITANNNTAANVSETTLANELNTFSSSPVYKQTTSSQSLFSYYNKTAKFKTDLKKALETTFSAGNKKEPLNRKALSAIFPGESILFDTAIAFKLTLSEAANYSELPATYKNFIVQHPMLKKGLAYPMDFLNETDWNLEANTADTSTAAQHEKVVNNYATEVWQIWNSTGDAHPIHIHLNRFRILGRQLADAAGNPVGGDENFLLPEPNEMAWKDVIRCKPGYINYFLVQYILNDSTQEGQFVYHCHILEHEDMSMMRRLVVKPDSPGVKYALSANAVKSKEEKH